MFLMQPSAPSKQVRTTILKNIDNGTLTPTQLETDDTIAQLQSQVASLTKEVMQWKDRHGRMEARERATLEFVQAQMDKQCQEANEHIETLRRRFEAKEKSLRLEHTKEIASIKQEIVAEQAQNHQGILDSLLIKHSKELDLFKKEISIQKAVCNRTKFDEIRSPPTIKRTELI
jgi:predicted RNase H-like nuclease (RuvC/YqgF family)